MDDALPEGFNLDQPEAPEPGNVDNSDAPPEGFTIDKTDSSADAGLPSGFQLDSEKYSTPSQEGLTGLEGVARGATAGLSDALAVGMRKGAQALGVPDQYLHYVAPEPQAIEARKENNPLISGGSELAGNIGLLNSLPKAGSLALNGMIQMGLISGGDELSKAMLGQGDPTPAVATHIAENAGLGLVGGALLGGAGHIASKLAENTKIGTQIKSLLAGAAHAANFPESGVVGLKDSAFMPHEIVNLKNAGFKIGQFLYKHAGEAATGIITGPMYGAAKGLGGMAIEHYLEPLLSPYTSKFSQKIAGPMLLKAATSGGVEHGTQILDHATSVAKGAQKISTGIESIFNPIANKTLDLSSSEKDRDKLKDFIEQGGVNRQLQEYQQTQNQSQGDQGLAEGGEVKNIEPMSALTEANPIAKHWPEQNTLINAAKARMSNYLNSQRPVPNPKLPYDREHKDHHREREYHKTLDLANQPLSVLAKIKDGSLLPKHMQDLTGMYPELHSHLSKKLTERITQGQLDGEKKPSYKVRQAMSLFLGSSLDSTLTQPSMAAVQNIFAQQRAQKQAPPSSKSNLSKLGQSTMTAEQSREARQNKS